MKHLLYSTIIAISLLSCAGKNNSTEKKNLEALRKTKTKLSQEQSKIYKQLQEVEAQIEKIDPFRKVDLVSTQKVIPQNFNHFIEIQGNIETKKNVLIYPETSGLLEKVFVKKGEKVSKGQLLGSINDGGFSQQISQAEIQRDLAKTTFERQDKLWKQNIGSEIQYLQTKTNYEAHEKALQQLRERYTKTLLTAPFSGYIDDIIREEGTIVNPGPNSEVFRIVCLKNMYVKAEIPENNLPNIQTGTKVEVYIPVLEKLVKSKIRQVSHHINPDNRTFSVEVHIPNKDGLIKPNLTARLRINDYTNNEAILIPQSAISEDSENFKNVYIVNDEKGKNIAIKQRIETGKTKGDFIEITEGLTVGDQIIIDGARKVKNTQEVKIIAN